MTSDEHINLIKDRLYHKDLFAKNKNEIGSIICDKSRFSVLYFCQKNMAFSEKNNSEKKKDKKIALEIQRDEQISKSPQQFFGRLPRKIAAKIAAGNRREFFPRKTISKKYQNFFFDNHT